MIEKFEALDIEKAEHMETNAVGPSPSSDTRQGRSEKRAFPRKRVSSWGQAAPQGWLGGGSACTPCAESPPHRPGLCSCQASALRLPPLHSDLLEGRPVSCSFISEPSPSLLKDILTHFRSQI